MASSSKSLSGYDRAMAADRARTPDHLPPRGLLVVAEGLDGSGKSATLDGLARWLERRGREVRTIAWEPSEFVARAAVDLRSRTALTPRVAALLAAADAQHRIGARVSRRLTAGDVVLADRYAWTAIAREVARGLDLDWSGDLHRSLPAPDIVLYHRGDAGSAVERALATRPASVRSAAVGAAYGTFVERLLAAFDALAERARNGLGMPWPTRVVELDVGADPIVNARIARDAIRPLVEADGSGRAA
jgi:thymidylate kinase